MKTIYYKFMIFIGILIFPHNAFSGGFGVYEQGATAMGQAGAFSARADNPSAIFYNPAGILQLDGTQVSLGTTAIIVESEFESTVTGNTTDMYQQITYPSNFYITYPLSDDFSIGFGAFSPFGLKTRFPDDWEHRFLSYRSSVETIYFNPTLAWRPDEKVMLGFGISYVYGTAELRNRVYLGPSQALESDLNLHDGDGDGWGYNFGALIFLTDKTSLGLAFRSQVRVEYDGQADLVLVSPPNTTFFSGGTYTTIRMPPMAVIGLSQQVSDGLSVEIDLQWTGWSSVKSLDLTFDNPAFNTSLDRNWEDTFTVRVGGEYSLDEHWALRAGYSYDETPVPDETVDPILQDSSRNIFAVGLGFTTGPFTTDAAYELYLLNDRAVNNQFVDAFGNTFNQIGTYKTHAHLFGLNLTYRF